MIVKSVRVSQDVSGLEDRTIERSSDRVEGALTERVLNLTPSRLVLGAEGDSEVRLGVLGSILGALVAKGVCCCCC